ncbi:hypothetical protein DFH29DRAFT_122746 [Suillus ampliporus]|nr:hypothetical protein DFH29DRAFT_122746 [Suillus ampliporus]
MIKRYPMHYTLYITPPSQAQASLPSSPAQASLPSPSPSPSHPHPPPHHHQHPTYPPSSSPTTVPASPSPISLPALASPSSLSGKRHKKSSVPDAKNGQYVRTHTLVSSALRMLERPSLRDTNDEVRPCFDHLALSLNGSMTRHTCRNFGRG